MEYGTATFAIAGTAREAISENAYAEELVADGIHTGLAVSYEALGACTINASGTELKVTETGVCAITATQAGNSSYREALAAGVEFEVLAIPSAITFAWPPAS